MNLQIIPKQNVIPDYDSKAIKIQHIEYVECNPSGNINVLVIWDTCSGCQMFS